MLYIVLLNLISLLSDCLGALLRFLIVVHGFFELGWQLLLCSFRFCCLCVDLLYISLFRSGSLWLAGSSFLSLSHSVISFSASVGISWIVHRTIRSGTCLVVCLVVCPFVSNKHQHHWIDQVKILWETSLDPLTGRFTEQQNWKINPGKQLSLNILLAF